MRSGRALVQGLLFLAFPAVAAGALVIRSLVVQGEWHEAAVGRTVSGVRLRGLADTVFPLPYPSAIYVYSEDCRHCARAARRLMAFTRNAGRPILPVFALSHNGRIDSAGVEALAPAVHPARLAERNPSFSFVRQVPMIIRIGPGGVIERAFIGVPDDRELESLLAPDAPAVDRPLP